MPSVIISGLITFMITRETMAILHLPLNGDQKTNISVLIIVYMFTLIVLAFMYSNSALNVLVVWPTDMQHAAKTIEEKVRINKDVML